MFENLVGIEVNVICLLTALLILGTLQKSYQRKLQTRAFCALLLWFIAFCVIDGITHIVDPQNIAAMHVLICLKVITCVFVGYNWFTYTFYATANNSYGIRRWAPLVIAPPLAVSIYAIVVCIKHISDTELLLDPLLWLFLNIVGNVYFIAAVVVSVKRSFRSANPFQKGEYRRLSLAAIIPLIAMFVQYKFIQLNITSPVIILTILYMYLLSLKQQIFTDPATGLNNKHKMTDHIDKVLQNPDPEKRLFFVQIGVDYYEKIRKKFGKKKALLVIEKVAWFLRSQCHGQNAFLARYSADKFAIICEKETLSELEFLCNEIIRNSETGEFQSVIPWKISLNVYWSEYGTEKTQTVDDWLNGVYDNCIKPATETPES